MENTNIQNPISEPVSNPILSPKPKAKDYKLIAAFSILILIFLSSTVFLAYQNFQLRKQIAQLQTQPSPTPTATTDPTANWKTFSDSDKGVEFKYPESWTVKTYSGSMSPIYLENRPFEFSATKLSTSITVSLEEVREETGKVAQENMLAVVLPGQKGLFSEKSIKIVENFSVGGKKATQISGTFTLDIPELGGKYSKRTFVPLKDHLMIINLSDHESENVYDQILSTFKFLDNGDKEGQFCGGIQGISCPQDYSCRLDGNYPDAGGKCVKATNK